MKNKIDPRMDKMLNLQVNMVFINAVLASCISIYLVFFESDQFGLSIFSILGTAVLAFVLNKILNAIAGSLILWVFYRGDTDSLAEDAHNAAKIIAKEMQEETIEQNTTSSTKLDISLKIKDLPSHPVGSFLDEPIYEWIDFSPADDESKIFRAHFEGTINLEKVKEYTIPDGCILLPPGLLYKV